MASKEPRWTDPAAKPAPATAEQPIRVKGAWAVLVTNLAIVALLTGIVFRAGGMSSTVDRHTTDIEKINAALAALTLISRDVLEGRDADRETLKDIRERLRALEAKR